MELKKDEKREGEIDEPYLVLIFKDVKNNGIVTEAEFEYGTGGGFNMDNAPERTFMIFAMRELANHLEFEYGDKERDD